MILLLVQIIGFLLVERLDLFDTEHSFHEDFAVTSSPAAHTAGHEGIQGEDSIDEDPCSVGATLRDDSPVAQDHDNGDHRDHEVDSGHAHHKEDHQEAALTKDEGEHHVVHAKHLDDLEHHHEAEEPLVLVVSVFTDLDGGLDWRVVVRDGHQGDSRESGGQLQLCGSVRHSEEVCLDLDILFFRRSFRGHQNVGEAGLHKEVEDSRHDVAHEDLELKEQPVEVGFVSDLGSLGGGEELVANEDDGHDRAKSDNGLERGGERLPTTGLTLVVSEADFRNEDDEDLEGVEGDEPGLEVVELAVFRGRRVALRPEDQHDQHADVDVHVAELVMETRHDRDVVDHFN